MKKIKKLILSLGVVTAVVAPIATVISCGTTNSKSKNQNELNNISVKQIEDGLIKDHKISLEDNVTSKSNVNPLNVDANLNGLSDVNMKVTAWILNNSEDSITFSGILSKKGLNSKQITNGVLIGFAKTDQQKLDAITNAEILSAFDVKIHKNLDVLSYFNTQPSNFNSIINGMKINVAPLSWTPEALNNSIAFDVILTYNSSSRVIKGLKLTGFADTDQQKLNAITNAEILSAFDVKIHKNLDVWSYFNTQPSNFNSIINGIKINVAPMSWTPEALNNSIAFDVILTYNWSSRVIKGLKLTSFADTDQQRMNQIQVSDIMNLMYSKLDIRSTVIDPRNSQIEKTILLFRSRNFVVTTSNWNADRSNQSIVFDATISYSVSSDPEPITSRVFKSIKLVGFKKVNTTLNFLNNSDSNLVSWDVSSQTLTVKSIVKTIASNNMIVYPKGMYMGQKIKNIIFAPNSQLGTIGGNAFMNLKSLDSISIPANVTTISSKAFDGALNYNAQILFAENSKLKFIGASAFDNDALNKAIELPANLLYVGTRAFADDEFSALTFLGECPIGTTRLIHLGSNSFMAVDISFIQGTKIASQKTWQKWAHQISQKHAFDW